MDMQTAYWCAFVALVVAVAGCWAGDWLFKWAQREIKQRRLDEILPPPDDKCQRQGFGEDF